MAKRKKTTQQLSYLSYSIIGFYWLSAIIIFLALISYTATDPSFNSLTIDAQVYNYVGIFGSYLADFLGQLFGLASYIVPATLLLIGAKLAARSFTHNPASLWIIVLLLLLLLSFSVFISPFTFSSHQQFKYSGGVVGAYLYNSLRIGGNDLIISIFSGLTTIIIFSCLTSCKVSLLWKIIQYCIIKLCYFCGLLVVKILQVITPVEWYCKIVHIGERIMQSRIIQVILPYKLVAETKMPNSEPKINLEEQKGWLSRRLMRWKEWYKHKRALKAELAKQQQLQTLAGELQQWHNLENNSPIQDQHSSPVLEQAIASSPEDGLQKTAMAPKSNKKSTAIKAKLTISPINKTTNNFQLPPLELLKLATNHSKPVDMQEAYQQNEELKKVLDDYGIRGKMLDTKVGPVITLHEFEPAAGTKAARIIGLADDIARSMRAISARIAIINGKNAIGIELPNQEREIIYLRELLTTKEFTEIAEGLPIVLGKNIAGEPIIANLAKMPHLLVAGTTGSGKSVSINTMILSLLYRFTPEECKFIMVDPKMLELSVYDNIPHLLCPVVTEPKKAVVALKWVTKEMEDRYRAMAALGVRNIHGYNEKINSALQTNKSFKRKIQTGYNMETGEPVYEEKAIDNKPLPYIVVIVDEMADLMLVAGKEIENSIQRLAQMARAAGIHLIMATQRPSVDVITGVIKANFPTRISFQVTSKIDSRTIIGEQGAEQLLGQGDMLYMMGGGKILRAHGPFVSDAEIERIVEFLKSQGEPQYISAVTDAEEEEDFSGTVKSSGDKEEDLYRKAVGIVKTDGRTSISYVQRKLRIGYNKAAGIIERMEEEGILSAPDATGKREIIG